MTGDLDIFDDLTITGQGAGASINSGGIDRILDIPTDVSVTLQNLTITGGQAPDGKDGVADGGGIRNYGSLKLIDVIVSNNQAGNGSGGDPYAASGGYGGGIYSHGTSLIIEKSTITGNTSGTGEDVKQYGSGGHGGGIYMTDTTKSISKSTISGNTAGNAGPSSPIAVGGFGGGIYLSGLASSDR